MLGYLLGSPLIPALAVALLHRRGERSLVRLTSPARLRQQRCRAVAFYAALIMLVAALGPWLDGLAHKLFWAHMAQHLVLALLVAPLLVYSAPWTPIWRCAPLPARRRLGRAYMRSPGWRIVRRLGRRLSTPAVAWLLFNVDLCAWHVPALYGLTLRNTAVHELEHLSFMVLGVLFWMQIVHSPPLRPQLDQAQRVAYVLLAGTVAWGLAVVLAFAPAPLYAAYAHQASRPGGISALTDQHLAAGIMWGPGSVPYALVIFVTLYRWLDSPRRRPVSRERSATGSG
jgi:cytochrome c oxidase assembly factor CtaG